MMPSGDAAAAADWDRRNVLLLSLFGPVLIAAGVAGLTLPPEWSVMSGAVPYDLFHIVSGCVGIAIVLARSARGVILFNLAFGLGDLYQAVAGPVGAFPASLFRLKPADHAVHVALGLLLVGFALAALRSRTGGHRSYS